MNRPGSASNTSTPNSAATAARKSGRAANRKPIDPDQRAPTDPQISLTAGMSTRPTTAAITIAARVGSGGLEQPRQKQQRHDRQHRRDEPDSSVLAPAPPFTAVLPGCR